MAGQMSEKNDVRHIESARPIEHEDAVDHGFTVGADELPKGYFRSRLFVGSITAVGFNLLASTGGFALIAPVLGEIDVALSPPGAPSPAVTWLALVYTLGLAFGLLLVGRLSDIFGRRWFFIGGTILGAVGAAVAGTAKTLPVAIGGQTLVGLSACTGYSYAFISGELVPVKRRFIFNAIIFVFSIPTAGFGPILSTSFIVNTGVGWRGAYYLLIAANGITAILYAAFYFPPTFHQKHGAEKKMNWVKNFDYVGLLLFSAGLVLFICGIQSGGSLYPWNSPQIISMIVIGFLCLVALFVYEKFMTLKEPLIPIHLFRNRGWVASVLNLSLGASVYYSQAIIWPEMAANVYGEGRTIWVGWVSCLVGLGITIGEIMAGSVAKKIGKSKYQMLTAITLGTLFLGLNAINNIDSPKTAMALTWFASIFIGWNEALALPLCTILIDNQQEIGTAAGLAGSSRSAISTVAATIYTVVLTARVTTELSTVVPAAVVAAGLPATSVADYMTAIAAGGTPKALAAVPGLTEGILAIGARAYREAYMDAYRTIFFVSIAFGAIAIGITFFVPNVDHLMTESVAATLQNTKEDTTIGEVYHNKHVEAEHHEHVSL